MSKQTTTDFEKRLENILNDSFLKNHKLGEEWQKQEIKFAVSELVEDSFDRILKDGHGGGNWRRLIEQERQRFKEVLK